MAHPGPERLPAPNGISVSAREYSFCLRFFALVDSAPRFGSSIRLVDACGASRVEVRRVARSAPRIRARVPLMVELAETSSDSLTIQRIGSAQAPDKTLSPCCRSITPELQAGTLFGGTGANLELKVRDRSPLWTVE